MDFIGKWCIIEHLSAGERHAGLGAGKSGDKDEEQEWSG
jgi:hypothetical protein